MNASSCRIGSGDRACGSCRGQRRHEDKDRRRIPGRIACLPFYTADEVAAKHPTMGMVIQGGATPVKPDADTHPNHHLVLHVFDRKTGQAITDATVSLSFEPLGRGKKPAGASVEVPVVNMQAVGQGPKSTHYGNNVVMPAGAYRVTATVNDEKAVFRVAASDTPDAGGTMGGMKMH